MIDLALGDVQDLSNGQALFDDEIETLAPRGPTVLLACVDPAVSAVLADAIGHEGCEIARASDGASVLDWLGSAPFRGRCAQLVVADATLPGWGPKGALAAIRAVDPAIMVMLIIPAHDHQMHAEMRARGAFAVADQPLELERFAEAVRSAVWF